MKWYYKAILQKMLSIVPCGFCINDFLQESMGKLSSFNAMESMEEIKKLFIKPMIEKFGICSGLKILEIGTGWTPVLPTLLYLMGNECISFDKFKHLRNKRFSFVLKNVISNISHLNDIPGFNLDLVLDNYKKIHINDKKDIDTGWKYIAPINTTKLPVENSSQDVVVSRLVLQHIPKKTLPCIIGETYRVLKEGGIAIHKINLHDEYAQDDTGRSAINFLRFPSWFWNNFVNNSIKFVNQDRYPYYLKLFNHSGFRIVAVHKKIDDESYRSIYEMKIAKEFEGYSKEELATVGIIVILEKDGKTVKSLIGDRERICPKLA